MLRIAVKVYPFVLCLVTMSQQIFARAMAKIYDDKKKRTRRRCIFNWKVISIKLYSWLNRRIMRHKIVFTYLFDVKKFL